MAKTVKKAAKAKPAAKAPEAAKPKAHERKAKPSEIEMVEKGRRLVASYLEQRDGMDPETAKMVVDGMEPEEVNRLVEEANSAVIAATPSTPTNGAKLVEAADEPMPDFLSIPALAVSDLPRMVIDCANNAATKVEAEKAYKAGKKEIIGVLKGAGVEKVSCLNIKLAVYTGSSKHLSDLKLLEKGVSIDIINQCWEETKYEDVRVMVPKGGI